MAINFFKWITGEDDTPEKEKKKLELRTATYRIANEIMVRELALNVVANKIANAISKCEVCVYYNGERKKDEEWYRWNIQPNINQSGTQFWYQLISTLCKKNEVLVVPHGEQLFIADDFMMNDDAAFYEHTFTNIMINSLTLSRTYRMSEVFYFKLKNEKIKRYLNGTLSLYGGLINAAYSSYLVANGQKGILNIDHFAENEDDFEEYFEELINEDFKKFFENANAVMPLYDGYEYKPLEGKKTLATTRDFKALLDDVLNITAIAYDVPSSIVTGNVQDTSKAVDEFLTFCIEPIIEMLTDEMTRKSFTRTQIINGTEYRFDTTTIKHIDLFDIATSIDKLISSGFANINELRKKCKFDLIDKDWANKFFITKNYSPVEDILDPKGGDG